MDGFRVAVAAPIMAMFLAMDAVAQGRRGQQDQRGQQSQQSQPQCRLSYRGNFRLNGAQQYLARADQANLEDERRRNINDALRNLTDAVSDRGADQLTLWFFMGRAYAHRKDYAGADSSWTKAEALGDEDCKREISRRRRNEMVPLVNQAVEMMNQQQPESALASLRRAAQIYRGEPALYINMGSIYLDQNNTDSAVAMFRRGARASDDPSSLNSRSTALLNAARLLHRAERWAPAESTYREFLALRPRDAGARTDLAAVLTRQNKTDEASALYDSLLMNTDSLESFDLFETGVALFEQRRYEQAARAFDLGLRKNMFHRDALFNLTNTYVAANDGPAALAAAQRLLAVDSLNRRVWQLVAGSYQRIAQLHRTRDSTLRALRNRDSIPAADQARARARAYNDSTVWALTRRDSLPLEVTVVRFEPRDTTVAIRGAVQNLLAGERPAFTLTLEFLNATGEAVARQAVEVPLLNSQGNPGSVYDFNLTVSGRGILAYRYRTN